MEQAAEHKDLIYLVTSAAGLMGGQVCRQLLARGDKVRAFVLKGDPAVKYVPEGCEIVEGDVRDRESLKVFFTLPEGTEAIVIHMAAVIAMDPAYDQKVMDVNVGGTKNIIDFCLSTPGVKKLVYCSSTGAIPEQSAGTKIKEIDYFDETKVPGCYAQSKALATQEVLDAVHHRGLNACVVQPSGIMGPGDYGVNEVTQNLIRIDNGELPAGIDGTFNLCDARDLAQGVIGAADKGRCGECYILANEAIEFKDFCRIVSEQSGGKGVKFFLPIPVANVMGLIMETTAKLKGEKPLMTTFNIYNLARNNEFDSTKAREELGYKTRPYEETIKDMMQWLLEQGLIQRSEGGE